MKKVKIWRRSCEIFFNNNFKGVYRIIFSFITEGKDCYYLGLCKKNLWKCFDDLLNRSSVRRYRLNKLNKNKKLIPYTFNYLKIKWSIPEERLFTRKRLTNFTNYKINQFFDIMGDINKKYGQIFFISGSFAFHRIMTEKQKKKHFFTSNRFSPSDIDIFILGDKKVEYLKMLLSIAKERMKSIHPILFSFFSPEPGLYEIYFTDFTSRRTCYGAPNMLQFILKPLHDTPSDVFSFFDLDCCKVGFFVGDKNKVVSCTAFVRSMRTNLNHLDLYKGRAGWKHQKRIIKYNNYLDIKTTCRPEHPLSKYHTNFKNALKPIVIWSYYHTGKRVLITQSSGVNRSAYYKGLYYINKGRRMSETVSVTKDYDLDVIDIKEDGERKNDQKLPYICTSVGIVKRGGKYVYDEPPPFSLHPPAYDFSKYNKM